MGDGRGLHTAERRVLRTEDAAQWLGLAASTLEKLRVRGDGPRFVRLGWRAVGYDVQDLAAWLETRKRASTSEPARDGAP
jgi:predicted DNA-binding transcriptional regulator AlpA